MNWKMLSFIFIPLLLAGCSALHYFYQSGSKDSIITEEVLNQKIDLEPILREFDGQQG